LPAWPVVVYLVVKTAVGHALLPSASASAAVPRGAPPANPWMMMLTMKRLAWMAHQLLVAEAPSQEGGAT